MTRLENKTKNRQEKNMRLKLLLIIVNTTQGIGDFWREVNDANTSKAVVYNGFSKTTGEKPN